MMVLMFLKKPPLPVYDCFDIIDVSHDQFKDICPIKFFHLSHFKVILLKSKYTYPLWHVGSFVNTFICSYVKIIRLMIYLFNSGARINSNDSQNLRYDYARVSVLMSLTFLALCHSQIQWRLNVDLAIGFGNWPDVKMKVK